MAVAEPAHPASTHISNGLPVFSVIDIETSGLSTRRHRILQVAVARVDRGEIVDEWSSLIRLDRPWQRVGPRRVHGITRERLRGAPRRDDALREFASRTNGTVLVAHNMRFDWPFIERAARKRDVPITTTGRVCTLTLSRRLDPDRELSHRLGDVCARYDIVNEHPHDAVYDARATALLLPLLLADHGVEHAGDVERLYER